MTAIELAPKPAGPPFRLRPTLLVPLAAVVFAALVGLVLIASVGVNVPADCAIQAWLPTPRKSIAKTPSNQHLVLPPFDFLL